MEAATLLPELIQAAERGPWQVVDEVAAALEPLGFSQRRIEGAHGAALFTRGAPCLCFSGHVDVVPVGVGWTRAPFGGEVAEGRIWGRGACDMLGSVACFVEAAARVPEAPLAILLTPDEETAMLGAQHVVEQRWLSGIDAIVVGEPTSHEVGIAEKGVLWVRVKAEGRNAHGSMPHLGDNAAERLVRILPRVLAVPAKGEHPLLGRATRNLGQLHGGEAVNQVPAEAHADLDIRYLPGQTDEEWLKGLRAAVAASGEAAGLEVLSSHVPFETPRDAPIVRRALAAVEAARGEARAIGLPYGTEASKFAPAGFDVVILGPGEPGLAHTNQESMALADLEAGAATYAHLLRGEVDRAE